MKKSAGIFVITSLLLSACSPLMQGTAEITGLALLHERRNADIILLDEQIELKASLELNLNHGIRNQCHWNITAYNGRALITGETPTEFLQQKIIESVRAISGVKSVYNELRIAPVSSYMNRSIDSVISSRVKTALSYIKNLPGFDATRVKVVTENKTVYLMGLVHSNEGQVATEVARREKGVSKVVKIFEYIDSEVKSK